VEPEEAADVDDPSPNAAMAGMETEGPANKDHLPSDVAGQNRVETSSSAIAVSKSMTNMYFDIEKLLMTQEHTRALTRRIQSPAEYSYVVDVPDIPCVGLPNIKNSCYFNAVIQLFFRIKCVEALFTDTLEDMTDQSTISCYSMFRDLFNEFIMASPNAELFHKRIKVPINKTLQVLYVRFATVRNFYFVSCLHSMSKTIWGLNMEGIMMQGNS